eukprot:916791-Pleurochrysis_carterae.AAC.3
MVPRDDVTVPAGGSPCVCFDSERGSAFLGFDGGLFLGRIVLADWAFSVPVLAITVSASRVTFVPRRCLWFRVPCWVHLERAVVRAAVDLLVLVLRSGQESTAAFVQLDLLTKLARLGPTNFTLCRSDVCEGSRSQKL